SAVPILYDLRFAVRAVPSMPDDFNTPNAWESAAARAMPAMSQIETGGEGRQEPEWRTLARQHAVVVALAPHGTPYDTPHDTMPDGPSEWLPPSIAAMRAAETPEIVIAGEAPELRLAA